MLIPVERGDIWARHCTQTHRSLSGYVHVAYGQGWSVRLLAAPEMGPRRDWGIASGDGGTLLYALRNAHVSSTGVIAAHLNVIL